MEERIPVIEIWVDTTDDGEAIRWNGGNAKRMKLIAYIVNGHPFRLDEGYFMQSTQMSKEEYKQLLDNKKQ